MDPSLVGSQMSSDALCEESSIREGAGYDKAFGSSDESEDFSPLSERETSAQSPDGNVKSYIEGSEEVEGEDEVEEGKKGSESDDDDDDGDEGNGHDEDDDDGDEESCEGTTVGPRDNRPFILPEEWAVNRFLPLMSDKIFKELRTQYQISAHISIYLPREKERCYSRRIADIGMYNAMFVVRLRLLLTALHRQLADFLGLSISHIALNAWRIFISVEILLGHLRGGNRHLTLDEFFYCYKPHHIASSKGRTILPSKGKT